MSFYRYYQTKERGDTTPILVRQTVPTMDTHECLWTALEAFVNNEWIDGTRSYSGIWLNGDGTATRVRTPPDQPDSPDSPSIGSPDAAGPPTPIPPKPPMPAPFPAKPPGTAPRPAPPPPPSMP
jgi:hypothetical protein